MPFWKKILMMRLSLFAKDNQEILRIKDVWVQKAILYPLISTCKKNKKK